MSGVDILVLYSRCASHEDVDTCLSLLQCWISTAAWFRVYFSSIRFHGVFMSQSVMRKSLRTVAPAVLCLSLFLTSCSSSKPPSKPVVSISNETRYRNAVAKLDKKKYDQAALELESLMFSTRATDLEGDVLYSLGTAYFQSKQYLLSSEIYRRLLQQTPNSPHVRDAQFQLARSYEKLSPFYELDQEYTIKAINEFQAYLDQYPSKDTSQISNDAETYRELLKVNPNNASYKAKYEAALAQLATQSPDKYCTTAISVLKDKLAHNRYSIAEQYQKLKKYRASGIYYEQVITFFKDSKWYEPAWVGKINIAVKRKRWFEARQAIEEFQRLFPDKRDKIEGLYKKVLTNFSNSRKSEQ
jgi:outer membrane protein assembly factor BamD